MRVPHVLAPSVVIALVTLLAPPHEPAGATSVLRTSITKMAAASDAVVMGRVIAREVRYDDAGLNIYTYVTVRVDSRFKGDTGADVRVLVPGGTVGDRTRVVHGAPSFSLHEKVVLFLERRTKGDAGWNVVGMFTGKLTVKPVPGGEAVDYGYPVAKVDPGDPPEVVRRKAPLDDFTPGVDLKTFVGKLRADVARGAEGK
ncbi:MAG TPA: hypothetical protein VG389_09720 [Myxococcota bacterium]|nr:hypothetical protein [Myxococcota bacterium]